MAGVVRFPVPERKALSVTFSFTKLKGRKGYVLISVERGGVEGVTLQEGLQIRGRMDDTSTYLSHCSWCYVSLQVEDLVSKIMDWRGGRYSFSGLTLSSCLSTGLRPGY